MQANLVNLDDAAEINTGGSPTVNIAVPHNAGASLAFEQWNGAAWVLMKCSSLDTTATGVVNTGPGGTGRWVGAMDPGNTRARVSVSIAGGAAAVAIVAGGPATDQGLGPAANLRAPSVVFAPYGTKARGVVTTLAELVAFLAEAGAPATVFVDFAGTPGGVITIPFGVYDMRGAELVALRDLGSSTTNTINMEVGAQFRNVSAISGRMTVQTNETTAGFPSFDWDVPAAPYASQVSFLVRNSTNFGNNGTQPAIIVDPAKYRLNIQFANGGSWVGGTASCAHLLTNGVAQLRTSVIEYLDPSLFTSADATATLYVVGDGSGTTSPKTAFVGFAGTVNWYLDGGNAVLAADRPLLNQAGASVFDTTSGKPIWWTGAAWVYADGTPA